MAFDQGKDCPIGEAAGSAWSSLQWPQCQENNAGKFLFRDRVKCVRGQGGGGRWWVGGG